MTVRRGWPIVIVTIAGLSSTAISARGDQSSLAINTAIAGPTLNFDWPAVEIGVGSYEEGPTGLTIIRFPNRASVVVDVRGGSPGTVNTDGLRLGYGDPFVDAVVFAGGSGYGEEAITAVMTGLKEMTGPGRVAVSTGAVINDFGTRRLNDIYPDQKLAQAALKAARPGIVPLGAQGAGRMAMQGGYFGCNAHSGQGAAFRQIGNVKIAAITVVNSSGVLTDRDGRLVTCHKSKPWGALTRTSELLQNLPMSLGEAWRFTPAESGSSGGLTNNTVLSLIVTNKKLDHASLQRLAVQVHTSMARAIQPFAAQNNGDTLFAASTQEVDAGDPSPLNLAAIAAEVMWDAALASVPAESIAKPPANAAVPVSADSLASFVGKYRFGPPDGTPSATPPRAEQQFGGLGLEIEMVEGRARVVVAHDDTPAARAGLMPGDFVSQINGAPLQGLTLRQALAAMRGPINTEVKLRIARKAQQDETEIVLTRALIKLPNYQLEVKIESGKLVVESTGAAPIFEFARRRPVAVMPVGGEEFYFDGRYFTRIAFTKDATTGKVIGAVLNPGRWQQKGIKVG